MSEAFAVARAIHMLRSAGTGIDFEEVVKENYRKILKPGDVAVDLGAHSGKHFGPMLELVGETGQVIAVEPLPQMFAHLQTEFGARRNAKLFNLAMSDFDGETTFRIFEGGLEESGLLRKLHHADATNIREIPVKVARADTLFSTSPNAKFIKIDVEGAEIRLLEGARAYLRRSRPYICVEYGYPNYSAYGNSSQSLYEFASSEGFICADMYGNLIDTPELWDRLCDWSYWDYMLVPNERVDEYKNLYVR